MLDNYVVTYNCIVSIFISLGSCQMEPFIIGGDYTDITQYPHAVFLLMDCVQMFICGGSIVTNRVILTAAHCLFECNVKRNRIIVKYGHQTLDYMKSQDAKKYIIHDSYNDMNLHYDIALIHLITTLDLGDYVKRVAILKNFPKNLAYAYVAGWGVINVSEGISPFIIIFILL